MAAHARTGPSRTNNHRRWRTERAGPDRFKRGSLAHSAGIAGQMTIASIDCMRTVENDDMGLIARTNGHADAGV